MDARGPEGLIIQTFDNGVVWVADDGGPRDAPPQFAGILKAGVQRDIISMLLAVNDNRVTSSSRRGCDPRRETGAVARSGPRTGAKA